MDFCCTRSCLLARTVSLYCQKKKLGIIVMQSQLTNKDLCNKTPFLKQKVLVHLKHLYYNKISCELGITMVFYLTLGFMCSMLCMEQCYMVCIYLFNNLFKCIRYLSKIPIALINGKALITGAPTAQTQIIINRPGVAGYILKTTLLLIDSLIR